VGEVTGGGAHPVMGFYLTDELVADIPTARAINPITKTNWEGVGVRPDVEVKGTEALGKAHELALGTLPATAPPEQRMQADWLLMGSKAAREKQELSPDKLKSYAGDYGERKVSWIDGELIYERPDLGSRAVLEPMGDDLFSLKENTGFRIRFDRDAGGNITGLTGLYMSGRSDVSPRVR
jgi:retinol-binding protein 3